jgi:UDP-glucose 4-epimerase
MNILVTGGSGFVGGYVFRYFQEQGYSVKNFDLYGDESDTNYIKGSILDSQAVIKTIVENDISIVFHFAGFSNINKVKDSPRECIDLNILGTTNILEASRLKGDTSVILASSVYVHSKHGHLYTTSKAAAERILNNYSSLYNINSNIIRLGTVYGEMSRHEDVISIFAKKVTNKKSISISGDGTQTRNFIHGEDVAKACESIIINKVFGEVLIVSSELPTSINQIASYFKDIDPNICIVSDKKSYREDDYDGNVGEVNNTFIKLNWKPEIGIRDGIERLISYFQG